MNNEVVLQVDKLSKRFKVYPTPWHRLQEWATLGRKLCHADFWALHNVSFTMRRGEFLGIIGVNGAGKTTLLKIITGVLQATEGSYQTQGRVLSLLELGIGMNEALTGRENVLTSAQLLGFPDNYAQEQMAQIVEFSELGDFFERPIATYSTGMRMRLAFSMFAFLECDILILDEVTAVGDIFFQQKCYARLSELIAKNTAIILVTHDLNAIQYYCDEVMVLHRGEKIYQGQPTPLFKPLCKFGAPKRQKQWNQHLRHQVIITHLKESLTMKSNQSHRPFFGRLMILLFYPWQPTCMEGIRDA